MKKSQKQFYYALFSFSCCALNNVYYVISPSLLKYRKMSAFYLLLEFFSINNHLESKTS